MLTFKYSNFCKFVLAILNQYVNMHQSAPITACNQIKVIVLIKAHGSRWMVFRNKLSLHDKWVNMWNVVDISLQVSAQNKEILLQFAIFVLKDVQSTITHY